MSLAQPSPQLAPAGQRIADAARMLQDMHADGFDVSTLLALAFPDGMPASPPPGEAASTLELYREAVAAGTAEGSAQ